MLLRFGSDVAPACPLLGSTHLQGTQPSWLCLSVCPEDQAPHPVPKTDSSRQGHGAGMGCGDSRSQEGVLMRHGRGSPRPVSSHTHCTCCPHTGLTVPLAWCLPLCADQLGRVGRATSELREVEPPPHPHQLLAENGPTGCKHALSASGWVSEAVFACAMAGDPGVPPNAG